MKNQPMLKIYTYGIFFLILTFCNIHANAQQTLINVDGWNAYVHLPSDYDQTTHNYPTIIFIPGLGEVGTDPNKLIANGPGAYIKQGWNGEALGVKFIVISLQPPTAWPNPTSIKPKINKLKSDYRIGNIYMTGLSMGGYAITGYATQYPEDVTDYVGVEALLYYEDIKSNTKPPALAGQRYLLFEQKYDYRKQDSLAYWMNYWKTGSGTHVMTNFGGGGHCCWADFYGGGSKQPSVFSVEGENVNIYEWFAQNAMAKGILPVTIESIAAKPFENAIVVSWNTSSELNSRYFEVQRSTDGKDFRKLGTVSAAGNSNILKQYFFRDELPANGNNFYRLKTVDLDGKYELSKTVSVQVKTERSMLIKSSVVNRASGQLKLDVQSGENTTASIFITDINGRIFYRSEKYLIEGNNFISDKITIPAKGVYYLRVSAGENLITRPLYSE